jgi:glycosyltransferase involved in cell wall biosynthesis
VRIGIDGHLLGKQKGGAEHTVEVLVRALAAHDQVNDYFVYVTGKHGLEAAGLPSNFHLKRLWSGSPWLGRLFLLPYYYWRDRLDAIHVQRAASLIGCPHSVVHVHDAMYATHPKLFPYWKRVLFNNLFRLSGRRAARVITPSQASKNDIVRFYGIDPDKVHILPDTVNTLDVYPEHDNSKITPVLDRFRVRKPYVLYLGAMERNKNVHVLVEAFAQFVRKVAQYQLVLAGKWRSETRSGYTAELEGQIDRLGIRQQVVTTGWVTKEERRILLSSAAMFTFPSAAEGLGVPPLEAMTCGVPAIASDIASIREYYGDSILLCKVDDPTDLAHRMVDLATQPELHQKMVRLGLERAVRDRWDYKTPKMIEIYRLAARLESR